MPKAHFGVALVDADWRLEAHADANGGADDGKVQE
jgi:hypothetical protein